MLYYNIIKYFYRITSEVRYVRNKSHQWYREFLESGKAPDEIFCLNCDTWCDTSCIK